VDIDVGAMQREVAMREGEARRSADARRNRAPLYPFGCVRDPGFIWSSFRRVPFPMDVDIRCISSPIKRHSSSGFTS
jgi:hypothetical protein